MFHTSTTLWHQPSGETSFHRENRLVFKEGMSGIEKYDATKLKVGTKVGGWFTEHMPRTAKGFRTLWTLAYPVRLGMFPIRYVLGPTIDGISWGAEKAARGGRYTAGFGKKVKNGIKKFGGSIFDIVKGPLLFAKKNIVDQTRSGIQGVFNVGAKAINVPLSFVSGLGESISAARTGFKEVFKEKWHPIKAANAARKAIWATLKAPFSKTASSVGEVAVAAKDMAKDMTGNVIDSVKAYPKQMSIAYETFKEGVEEFKGAHASAKTAMDATPAHKEPIEGEKHGDQGEHEGAEAKAKSEAEAKKAKAEAKAKAKADAKKAEAGHGEAAGHVEAAAHAGH